jgi:hypothetical protein
LRSFSNALSVSVKALTTTSCAGLGTNIYLLRKR